MEIRVTAQWFVPVTFIRCELQSKSLWRIYLKNAQCKQKQYKLENNTDIKTTLRVSDGNKFYWHIFNFLNILNFLCCHLCKLVTFSHPNVCQLTELMYNYVSFYSHTKLWRDCTIFAMLAFIADKFFSFYFFRHTFYTDGNGSKSYWHIFSLLHMWNFLCWIFVYTVYFWMPRCVPIDIQLMYNYVWFYSHMKLCNKGPYNTCSASFYHRWILASSFLFFFYRWILASSFFLFSSATHFVHK